MRVPLKDLEEESKRVIDTAEKNGVVLRLLGGVGYRAHINRFANLLELLKRDPPSDLDFIGLGRDLKKIFSLMRDLNYEIGEDEEFKVYHYRRIILNDGLNKRDVDIFLDKLEMCHTLDLRKRLDIDYPTIPLADLLLQKMEIVELTEKDVKDVLVLLREHDIGDKDSETVNTRYIGKLLSDDWGFYYTLTTNLKKVKGSIGRFEALTEKDSNDIKAKIIDILDTIERMPKTFKWRMRARIGTRSKWYKEVREKM